MIYLRVHMHPWVNPWSAIATPPVETRNVDEMYYAILPCWMIWGKHWIEPTRQGILQLMRDCVSVLCTSNVMDSPFVLSAPPPRQRLPEVGSIPLLSPKHHHNLPLLCHEGTQVWTPPVDHSA